MESYRILVADHNEEVVQQIASALTPLGYRIEAAGDGSEALGRLRAGTFELLILGIVTCPGWTASRCSRRSGSNPCRTPSR